MSSIIDLPYDRILYPETIRKHPAFSDIKFLFPVSMNPDLPRVTRACIIIRIAELQADSGLGEDALKTLNLIKNDSFHFSLGYARAVSIFQKNEGFIGMPDGGPDTFQHLIANEAFFINQERRPQSPYLEETNLTRLYQAKNDTTLTTHDRSCVFIRIADLRSQKGDGAAAKASLNNIENKENEGLVYFEEGYAIAVDNLLEFQGRPPSPTPDRGPSAPDHDPEHEKLFN